MTKKIPVLPRIKDRKKLKHITALMPVFKWEKNKQYIFRLPYKQGLHGSCKMQIRTHTYNHPNNLVWANIKGNKFSFLPENLCLKDVSIGYTFISKPNYVVWGHKNLMRKVPCHLVDNIMIKGTAISDRTLKNMYNPYKKYSKFTLNHLRHHLNLQLSLHRLVDGYKNQKDRYGKSLWQEIRDVRVDVWDKMTMTYSKNVMKNIISSRNGIHMFNIPHNPLALVINPRYFSESEGFHVQFLYTNKNYINETVAQHFERAENYPYKISIDNHKTMDIIAEKI